MRGRWISCNFLQVEYGLDRFAFHGQSAILSTATATTVEPLEKKALALPATSRVRLVERILESVEDFSDIAVARSWDAEIARRVREIRSGKAKGIPAGEVFAKARRALHETRRLSSVRRK
jgi:putative addiction module component (TIGR02574 family)